jgi:chaperonin GroES
MTKFNFTDADPRADYLNVLEGRGLKPLGDRILVRRIDDDRNGSLLIIPECATKPSRFGVVVAVGPGKRDAQGYRRPLCVKPGDRIQFGRFTDHDDGSLLLITEQDVVGVIKTEGD